MPTHADDRGGDAARRTEAVELAAVSLSLVCVAAAVGLAYRTVLPFGTDFRLAVLLVGPPIGAAAYANARGLDVGYGLPRRDRLSAAFASVVLPGLVVAVAAFVGDAVGFSLGDAAGRAYAPGVSFAPVARANVVPAVTAGVGYAFLSCVVVHEQIRTVVASKRWHAVAVTAVTAVFFRATLFASALTLAVSFSVRRAILALVLATGTVAAGFTLGLALVSVRRRSRRPLYRPAYVPVYALAVVTFGGSLAVVGQFPDAVEHALWGVGFATAAVGYERSRSVWVPVLALAFFEWSLDICRWATAT